MSKLYCPIRKEWFAALPEEQIRQRTLQQMIDGLGYPAALISVEKALKQLPHLSDKDCSLLPDRRADIICFTSHPTFGLYPLLMIECKAVPLTKHAIGQITGYNQIVRACFIALVNQLEMRMGWFDKKNGEYRFINQLPDYQTLISTLQRN